ncbi:MAG TPA: DUF1488 domain-containing protein [Trinickia sp.]|jgi:hypothetical protein|nr:DUF1488 domain-containing protein [Trinickia sp.]
MQITFPQEPAEYCGRDLVLAFAALVDGERVQCAITAEALEDHFGARSLREQDVVKAFELNRHTIERAAQELLRELGKKPVLLHSGFFGSMRVTRNTGPE